MELGSRDPAFDAGKAHGDVDEGFARYPKLITLGGDHSIALPALRALHELYQKPIAVVHFDAHCDVGTYPWLIRVDTNTKIW